MDENEQYVRSVWEKVHYCSREETNSCCGPSVFIAPFDGRRWVADFSSDTKAKVFSFAADFTRQRLEEVRQLRYEISLLKLIHAQGGWGGIDGEADKAAILRTVSRLEYVFTEKTRGMKEEAWK